MKYSPLRPLSTAQRIALLMTGIALGATLSGCSASEEREYALPRSLCDVTVDPDLLSPFLPSGEKVSARQETPNDGTQRCNVSVDNKVALVAGQLWWDEGGSVAEVAAVHAQVGKGRLTDDEMFFYSGTGAVGKVEGCRDSSHPNQILFTTIQVFTSGRDDTSTMKRLITDYTKQVHSNNNCK